MAEAYARRGQCKALTADSKGTTSYKIRLYKSAMADFNSALDIDEMLDLAADEQERVEAAMLALQDATSASHLSGRAGFHGSAGGTAAAGGDVPSDGAAPTGGHTPS